MLVQAHWVARRPAKERQVVDIGHGEEGEETQQVANPDCKWRWGSQDQLVGLEWPGTQWRLEKLN